MKKSRKRVIISRWCLLILVVGIILSFHFFNACNLVGLIVSAGAAFASLYVWIDCGTDDSISVKIDRDDD